MSDNWEEAADILSTDGRPLGQPGSNEDIRELAGGRVAAGLLFDRLSRGGVDVTPHGYPGRLVRTVAGGYVGYRPASRDGPLTIDVNIPGINIRKLKFKGSCR